MAEQMNREDELPFTPDERELHERLARDGAAWRASVASHERLDARVRALPQELPRSARGSRDRRRGILGAGWGASSDDERANGNREGRTMTQTRVRRLGVWVGSAAALLVVALMATIFARLASGQTSAGSGPVPATPTPQPAATPAPTPFGAQPTPGPGAQYIPSVVTATGVDASFAPVHPTTQFEVGQTVYVVYQVRHVPANSQHSISIRWFFNGQDTGLDPNSPQTQKPVTHDADGYFGLTYPQAGAGMAKIYWDLPAGTTTANAAPALTLLFVVGGPGLHPTPTPAPARTPTPPPTPAPTPAQPPTPTPTPAG